MLQVPNVLTQNSRFLHLILSVNNVNSPKKTIKLLWPKDRKLVVYMTGKMIHGDMNSGLLIKNVWTGELAAGH
jgi:hypothetical protein